MSRFLIRTVGSDSQTRAKAKTQTSWHLYNAGRITMILLMSHFTIFSGDRSLLNGLEMEVNDKDDTGEY